MKDLLKIRVLNRLKLALAIGLVLAVPQASSATQITLRVFKATKEWAAFGSDGFYAEQWNEVLAGLYATGDAEVFLDTSGEARNIGGLFVVEEAPPGMSGSLELNISTWEGDQNISGYIRYLLAGEFHFGGEDYPGGEVTIGGTRTRRSYGGFSPAIIQGIEQSDGVIISEGPHGGRIVIEVVPEPGNSLSLLLLSGAVLVFFERRLRRQAIP